MAAAARLPRLRVSSGLATLDETISGGFVQGDTVLVIARGGASLAGVEVLRCAAGEAAACSHPVLWLSGRGGAGSGEEDGRRAGELVPGVIERRAPSGRGDPGAAEEDAAGSQLRIAWQYRRYLAANRALDDRDGGSVGGGALMRPADRRLGSSASAAVEQWQPVRSRKGASVGSGAGFGAGGGGAGARAGRRAPGATAHALDMTRGIGAEAARALPAVWTGVSAPQRAVEDASAFLRSVEGARHGGVPRIVLECPSGRGDAHAEPAGEGGAWDEMENGWIMAITTIACLVRRSGALLVIMLRTADWSESGIALVAHRAGCVLSVHARGETSARDGADPERCIGYLAVERAPHAGAARVAPSQPFALHRRRRRLCVDRLEPPPLQAGGPAEPAAAAKGRAAASSIDF